jgi:hypothetical protein
MWLMVSARAIQRKEAQMNVGREVTILQGMTTRELRAKHEQVFGEPTRSGHKQYLIRRIAWRLQSLAEGDLSERARQRAMELARDADIRTTMPRDFSTPAPERTTVAHIDVSQDDRLPLPGAQIARKYKGQTHIVAVLPHGFEYNGTVYRTLSAVAQAITGTHWNGYHFFNLGRKGDNGTDE